MLFFSSDYRLWTLHIVIIRQNNTKSTEFELNVVSKISKHAIFILEAKILQFRACQKFLSIIYYDWYM